MDVRIKGRVGLTVDNVLNAHEEGIIRSFIGRSKREQFLRRLANPKTRNKQLDKFNHFYDLDPRYAHLIPPRDQTPAMIFRLLKAKGAPDSCHIMGNSDLDGREMPLPEAVQQVLNESFAHFISCQPGKLGFFQDEDAGRRYILER